jgi:hypothetical protein
MFDRWVAYLDFPAFAVLVLALVLLLPEFIRAVREHRERREDRRGFVVGQPDDEQPR